MKCRIADCDNRVTNETSDFLSYAAAEYGDRYCESHVTRQSREGLEER